MLFGIEQSLLQYLRGHDGGGHGKSGIGTFQTGLYLGAQRLVLTEQN